MSINKLIGSGIRKVRGERRPSTDKRQQNKMTVKKQESIGGSEKNQSSQKRKRATMSRESWGFVDIDDDK